MDFSRNEQIAIAKVGKILVLADGRLDENEMAGYDLELSRIGISNAEDLEKILSLSEEMEPSTACTVISKMDDDKKTYVSAFLGTLMVIDEKIDKRELAVWGIVGQLCGLPSMTVGEAVQYMQNLN